MSQGDYVRGLLSRGLCLGGLCPGDYVRHPYLIALSLRSFVCIAVLMISCSRQNVVLTIRFFFKYRACIGLVLLSCVHACIHLFIHSFVEMTSESTADNTKVVVFYVLYIAVIHQLLIGTAKLNQPLCIYSGPGIEPALQTVSAVFHRNYRDAQLLVRTAHFLQCLGRLSIPTSAGW